MPTLGEASRSLRVSRHTLEKWLKRLGITPTQHPWDLRVYTITGEELQRIRETRAQMPGQIGQVVTAPAAPPVAAPQRRAPASRGRAAGAVTSSKNWTKYDPVEVHSFDDLPRGTVSAESFAKTHNLGETTMRRHTAKRWIPHTRLILGEKTITYFTPEQAVGAVHAWIDIGFIVRASDFHFCGDPSCACHLAEAARTPLGRDRDAGATRPMEKPLSDEGEGLDE